MFTGLIQSVGHVLAVSPTRFSVALDGPRPRLGESIALNGVCLTVVKARAQGKKWQADFDLSGETWRTTSLHATRSGDRVNVEKALRVGDALGGHWVQGHVEGLGRVVSREARTGWTRFVFSLPASAMRYCVPKGSIALDGISLTIVDVLTGKISVAVIPETLRRTTLGTARVGHWVNVESDILAKHVDHLLKGFRR